MKTTPEQAIKNIIENLEKGNFRIILYDEDKRKYIDVTKETIENLKRIIEQ